MAGYCPRSFFLRFYGRRSSHLKLTFSQEGGSVYKENTGSVLTTIMTSRLASVIFKSSSKRRLKIWNLPEKSQSDFFDLAMIRFLL